MQSHPVRLFPGLAILAFLLVQSLGVTYAQTSAGSITGVVKDESGAVLPGVNITARNLGTNETRTALTNDAGLFEIPKVNPGNYELKAELTGFKTVTTKVEVTVGAPTVVDLRMTVGEISETVTVTDTTRLVNTEEGRLSTIVTATQIDRLPINGRNPFALALMNPGVTPTFNKTSQTGGASTFQVNGQRHRGNNFLLDGTDNNYSGIGGTPALVPIQDTVEEFRLLTNSFSAEYGRNAGAIVSVITKAGTNEFHGSVYEFARNDAFDAANFFDRFVPQTGAKVKSPLKQHQFGFTLGGPIKKNQTFFFGAYEGFRQTSGSSVSRSVETQQLVDFVNQTRPGSLAAKVFKDFPPLLRPSTGTDLGSPAKGIGVIGPKDGIPDVGSISFFSPSKDNLDKYDIRIDHHFNNAGNDALFGRWAHAMENSPVVVDIRPGRSSTGDIKYKNLTVGENHVFGASKVNEARFGWNEQSPNFFSARDDFPTLSFDDGTEQFGAATNIPQFFSRGTYQYSDIFSWTWGNHGIKFGGEFRRNYENSDFRSFTRGAYGFRNILDFVDDESYRQQNNLDQDLNPAGTPRKYRQKEYGFFAQDDWKVTPHLTLNLGLRYDLFGVTTELEGKSPNIVFLSGNNVFERFASAQIQALKSTYAGDHNNLAPRLGFSWDPFHNGKTAIRGGYGITYERLFLNLTSNVRFSPPFTIRPTFDVSNSAPANAINYTIPTSLSEVQRAALRSGFGRLGPTTVEPDIRNLYVNNIFFGIQRQFLGNYVFEANYVGTLGRKLTMFEQYSRFFGDRFGLPDPLGRYSGDRSANGLNPAFSVDYSTLADKVPQAYHGGQFSLNRHFTNGLSFGGHYTISKNIDYDSDAFGSSADRTGSVEITQVRLERGLSGIHVAQRFASNFVYEFPFMREQRGLVGRILGGWQANGILTLQTGTPETIQTGSNALQWDFNGDGLSGDRPNTPSFGNNIKGLGIHDYVSPSGNPNGGIFSTQGASDNTSARNFFNGGQAFPANPAAPFIGNLGRNTFFSPNYKNVDFGLYKTVRTPWLTSEGSKVEFRAEFFNLFNRVNLQNWINSLDNNRFGQSTSAFAPRIVQFALRFAF